MYIVMIAGGIAVLAFLRWPFVGLVALLTGALLIPFGLGTGTQTDLNIVILLLPVLIGLWFLDMLVIQRNITLRPMRAVLPLLLLRPLYRWITGSYMYRGFRRGLRAYGRLGSE